ncbi:MAG: tRNA lysidine(34) synthetase TilS [Nevskiaceae bacterium]|nr:MAG: tRNA lysidine(34) synthetase TilS [Nevskiaceae bacterium]TBR71776.1 MAG: tRNA lysidine(34) synthetase TilS [Nevskiaceae bacterium]
MTDPALDLAALRHAAPPLAPGATYRVCFSGGLDSTVLLHALVETGVAPLTAVHIHHGLQAVADNWVTHCTSVCVGLGIPLETCCVRVAADTAEGPEAAARTARYAALRNVMQTGDCLVVAHHRDDQAETVLLRLLRGAGSAGLAAMRPFVPFAPGGLWRPLLDTPRATLQAWAQVRGLEWVEDPQNQDTRYRRVWLRREILPALRRVVPQCDAVLARTAAVLAEDAELLAEVATADLQTLRTGVTLSVRGLLALTPARRHHALRAWLAEQGFYAPDRAALERLDRDVLAARADATPVLNLGQCELRRYRDALHVMAPLPPVPQHDLQWRQGASLVLPAGCGSLQAAAPPPAALDVRFPQGGERLKPANGVHTRTLKNLFQEAGVPPWRRLRTPLVWHDGVLAWVGDVACSAQWQRWCQLHAWHLRWQVSANT